MFFIKISLNFPYYFLFQINEIGKYNVNGRGEGMKNDVLELKNINKSYMRNFVLKDLNMTVNKNDIYAFIGENGAGKTTTMRIIMSIIKQDSGEISLFGCTSKDELGLYRSKIGAIIENPAFYPYLSAYDNLKYYVKFKGITDDSIITDSLKSVGLGNTKKKKFKNFSLGMKQRLGLALALLNRPDLLILDEPFNGLDPQGMVEFRETLSVLNKRHGITIIISSHNLNELGQIATRYGFIHQGHILQEISDFELEEKCKKYILLEVSSLKDTVCILEDELKINDYNIVNDNTIQIFNSKETSETVAATVSTHGIGIRRIQECNISLEEYFLSLVKFKEGR